MKPDHLVRYTLRVNRELFRKFRYIADAAGRSANKEIEQYLKAKVKEYETKHGPIPKEDEEITEY